MTDPKPSRLSLSFDSRWATLAAGFLALFVAGGSRLTLGLALRPMAHELGWSRSVLGSAVFAFQGISAIAMFFSGRLADRASLRLLIGAGLLVSAFGIGLMGFVERPWQAIALYGVVFAVGNGLSSTAPVGAMVTRAFAGRAGLANGTAVSGLSFGQLVGIALMASVLSTSGWRAVFFVTGAAILFSAAPIAMAAPGWPASRPKRSGLRRSAFSAAVGSRRFWLLSGVYGICGFNDFFVATHIVAFAQDRGVSSLLAGELLALMGLTGLAGVLATGFWSDRLGPVGCTALSFVARAGVFALVCVTQAQWAIVVFALAFGATFLVTAPLTALFVRESFGMGDLGALTGLITMTHQMFGGLGAFLGAWIYDSTHRYDAAFRLMLASTLVAIALTWLLARPPKSASLEAPGAAGHL